MALAEARAAWQRTANRCFVQEDAKRAPKLACCPSAAQSSKQVDAGGPASTADGQDHATSGFQPPKGNPSCSNLSPNSRWWLQSQSYFGYEKHIKNDQLNTMETVVETSGTGLLNSASKADGFNQNREGDGGQHNGNIDFECSLNAQPLTACVREDSRLGKQDKDISESYEILDVVDTMDSSLSKQHKELCSDFESSWIGCEKSEPWWRVADKDELALFIAQRSLDLVENCDLPQPQSTHLKNDPLVDVYSYNHDVANAPCIGGHNNSIVHTQDNIISETAKVEQLRGNSQLGGYRPTSDSTSKDTNEMQSKDDPSKAQLLEALCHSQTRAREAEKAAKQAHEEKEHIVKLFLKQASHLFAYKQWFQLLQLENLYFQISDNNGRPISTLFPMALPWLPHKTGQRHMSWKKAAKRRHAVPGQPSYDISKYAVIFALGLGLVGAGLLLGWTVGWFLPIF